MVANKKSKYGIGESNVDFAKSGRLYTTKTANSDKGMVDRTRTSSFEFGKAYISEMQHISRTWKQRWTVSCNLLS